MIDSRAIIDPTAKIAAGVRIDAGAVIGPHVVIDEGTWVGSYAVIKGNTVIGKNNKIFQFASLGDEPQDITYRGEETRLEIGDGNVIREYAMISRGTVKGGGVTRIGNQNFIMAYAHIGHDCTVGNEVIMVSYSALSGHVTVDDYATIGGYAAIHQFCRVGAYAFISRTSYAPKDVLPYVIVAGYSAGVYGLNKVGLRRRGFSTETIAGLHRAYKVLFRQGASLQEACATLESMLPECPEIQLFIDGVNHATSRGIVRAAHHAAKLAQDA